MKEYIVKNLILGEFKDSYSNERIFVDNVLGKKSIISMPNSIEPDIADAFLAAKQVEAKFSEIPIAKLINIIKKVGLSYLTDKEKIKLISETTGSPISYVEFSIKTIKDWMINIDKYIEVVFGSIDNLENGQPLKLGNKKEAKIFFKPGGITSIILAGDEVSLSAYVITQALLSRNPIVVKPSTIELISCYELIKEFSETGLKDYIQLVCWNSQLRPDIIKGFIKNGKQAVLFGNDNTVNNFIYEKDESGKIVSDLSVNRKIIRFTTGKSGSIVMEEADIKLAVKEIIAGSIMNRGIECISTKKAYVHEKIYDNFIKEIVNEVKKIKIGKPLDKNVEISYLEKNSVNEIKNLSETIKVVCSNFSKDLMGLLVVEDPTNSSRFAREEIPGPVLVLIKVNGIANAINKANQSINQSISATSTSLFTKNKDYIKKACLSLKSYKINVNKSSAFMDFNVMHDGKFLVKELFDEKIIGSY